MTREEAIKIIDCYDIGFYDLSGEKIPADKLAEAFDMAIEALQGGDADMTGTSPYMQPSPDSGADLISRADAMMEARPEYLNPNDDYARGWNKAIKEYWETIKALPSAEAEQGEWIYKTNDESVCEEWECSKCGNWNFVNTDYCPNCGADMRPKLKGKEADVVTIDESI
jgi:rubrerythrin